MSHVKIKRFVVQAVVLQEVSSRRVHGSWQPSGGVRVAFLSAVLQLIWASQAFGFRTSGDYHDDGDKRRTSRYRILQDRTLFIGSFTLGSHSMYKCSTSVIFRTPGWSWNKKVMDIPRGCHDLLLVVMGVMQQSCPAHRWLLFLRRPYTYT